MANLGSLTATKAILSKHGFSANKRYGQNFLIEPRILERIIEAAELTKDDYVIEIGPGIGTLTQYLCDAAGFVTAIEIDKKLLPVLSDTLSTYDNAEVLNQDVLKTDIAGLIRQNSKTGACKVVANLPYYITTPIMMQLLESRAPLSSITVMVQKEVADRIRFGPGTKDYGALSLAVQYYAKPAIITEVPPSCFIPRPNVTSVVLKLSVFSTPAVSVRNEKQMFALIRASFNQRRKTLINGLKNAAGLNLSKETVETAVRALGKPLTVRGEELTLIEFAKLSDFLSDFFDNNMPLC